MLSYLSIYLSTKAFHYQPTENQKSGFQTPYLGETADYCRAEALVHVSKHRTINSRQD